MLWEIRILEWNFGDTQESGSTQELGFTKTDETEGFPPAFPLNYFPPQSGSMEIQGTAGDPAFPLNTGFPLNGGPDLFIYVNRTAVAVNLEIF